ncbi:MAG TPA: ATP-dependent zinc metalloprotease FtsH [Gemmatimonadaceae bacterium]|nr:ATP-dependent zinc metalloprotease FtsH [Gemmatimonadaceae bacterium]
MPNKNPKKPTNWSKISKQLSFWVFVILVPVAIIQFSGKGSDAAPEISYTPQYDQELQRNNIDKVTIQAGRLLTGEFKQKVPVKGRLVSKFKVLLPTENSSDEVTRLREHGVQIQAEDARPSFTTILISLFPYLLIFGIWFFLFRSMQAGGAKAFSFGKSKAKLLTGDTPKVTFDDVAGADEAKVELQEIIEFLKDPQKFTKLGGRLPKGALLVGPPGTGKTLLARAVAGEAGRPFFSMSGSDFVEMFVGVGASRVRDLFEQGKAHAPCIIFIDEIDAVGRHRGAGLGGGHDEREQTLNQLLVEMDGFESNDGVILIAATNRPDVLDPALMRPGRFDRQIVVDSPDLRGREGILRVHIRNKPMAEDVDVTTLARGTPGMAGADLANLVNEGALLAARRNHDKVYMADLEDAKDKVMMGAERKSMVMKEEERKLTAYHEGGHAICAIKVKGNDPLHKVTIVPRGRTLGVAWTLPEDDRVSVTREQLEANLVKAYGGRVAEELVFGRDRVTTGAASDIQQATALARRYVSQWGLSDAVGPVLVGDNEQELFLGRELQTRREVSERTAQLVDSEVTRVIQEAYARATQVLQEHMELLHTVANALLDRETLTGDEVLALARGETLPPRAITPPPSAPPALTTPVMHPKPSKPPLFGGPEVAPA